jgi:hypothetical protein
VALDIRLAAELSQNVLGEDLAELDTHLVVRVDTPDSTLDVDLVLVHGNQRTKRARGELLEHDRVGWLVALEDFRLDESSVGSGGTELFLDLVLGLTESKSSGGQHDFMLFNPSVLWLSEKVGKENFVVLAAGDRVEGLGRGEEITKISQYSPGKSTKE